MLGSTRQIRLSEAPGIGGVYNQDRALSIGSEAKIFPANALSNSTLVDSDLSGHGQVNSAS